MDLKYGKLFVLLCLLASIAALAFWDLTSTRISVVNRTPENIKEMSVKIGEIKSGCGNYCLRHVVGSVARNKRHTLYWPTIREGSVAVDFTLEGQRLSTTPWGYVTSGLGQWGVVELHDARSFSVTTSHCNWWLDWIYDWECKLASFTGTTVSQR